MPGHIHQTAKIKEVLIIGDTKDLVIEVDIEWSKYLFEKGYVGINGCSITVGQISETRFKVHLIPETLRSTNLDNLVFGDNVNLELDQNTIAITDTTERVLSDKALSLKTRSVVSVIAIVFWSNSRFTLSPKTRLSRLVDLNVSGIR